MKGLVRIVFVFVVILNSCTRSGNDSNKTTGEVFTTEEGAINGYDAVAYFNEAMPIKGNTQFRYEWNGATWYFSSAANLDIFMTDPEKYVPQYGGYCAYGTANGHKAPTQPDAWTIVDGKLYLNYNLDVLGMWRKDKTNLINEADRNWPEVKKTN